MVDFNSLGLPGFDVVETNPRLIFKELPAGNERISNLWTGQETALDQWYKLKDRSDVIVELNTGAGKSVVGLLIAESAHRQGRKVVYVCPTTDLVEQVSRDADAIGVKYAKRVGGKWSDDGYKIGESFAITNYDSLLTPRSRAFSGDHAPETVIFDDAHVAESKIRDQYTVKVKRLIGQEINPQFVKLANLILESAPDVSWRSRFEGVLRDRISADPRMAPMNFGARYLHQIDEILSPARVDQSDPNFYVIDNLFGKWDRCIAVFVADEIDLIAPIPPVLAAPVFADRHVKRVYLSATMTQESDFARAFGRKVKERIRPDVDAGDGERLIVMSRKFLPDNDAERHFVRRLTTDKKVLIAVPSTVVAQKWADTAVPVSTKDFTKALNVFRSATTGRFIMVGRFDGIDLPHNECRLMAIDGLPTGGSLMEKLAFDRLNLRAELAAKVATRITQLFGRINRGQKDFGIYIVCSDELKEWLSTHRNLALLPDLIQKQVMLGAFLQSAPEVNSSSGLQDSITKVLDRDSGWTSYYSKFLRTQTLKKKEAEFAFKREEKLSELFLRQAEWFRNVWIGDLAASTNDLEAAMLAMSTYDQKTAGISDLWVGLVKELTGDREGATIHYESAQGRLLTELPFERIRGSNVLQADVDALDSFGRKQVSSLTGSLNAVNTRVNAVRRETIPLSNWDENSFRQLEEATRALGNALGFEASRPDSEKEVGPDGLWVDLDERSVLAFELKTEKEDENDLTKDEVGQCHNHEQWIRDNYNDWNYLGLIVVTDSQGVSGRSNPSESMYKCSSDRVRDLRAKLLDTIDFLKPEILKGDLSTLRQMSSDHSWALSKVADVLKESRLKSVG